MKAVQGVKQSASVFFFFFFFFFLFSTKQTQTEWVRILHTHNFKYLVVLKCAPFVPQFESYN